RRAGRRHAWAYLRQAGPPGSESGRFGYASGMAVLGAQQDVIAGGLTAFDWESTTWPPGGRSSTRSAVVGHSGEVSSASGLLVGTVCSPESRAMLDESALPRCPSGGLFVTLAAQSIPANLIASVLLQTRRLFRRGD